MTSPTLATTRLLLVEDDTSLRMAMRMLISGDSELALVGEAEDGPTAVTAAAELGPDVILMDVMMPGAFDGVEATRRILAAAASRGDAAAPLVIALSASSGHREAMLKAGAVAFLTKTGTADLLATIKGIARSPG